MTNPKTVHILDKNVARRGSIARQIYTHGMHAEIYERLSELTTRPPSLGLLLASDEDGGPETSEIIGAMGQTGSFVPVAMYSSQPDAERIVSAMLSGALDYLEWPFTFAALNKSLERLEGANKALAARRHKEAQALRLVESLTVREREVLHSLVGGAANKDMAKAMGISARTVEIHRGNMMRKLNASTVSDAVRIGLLAGVDS